MFESMLKKHEDLHARTKYLKYLGWHEYDDEGIKRDVVIVVYDLMVGYGVIKDGKEKQFLFHAWELDDAVEYAVDEARKQINNHEFLQKRRD